MAEQRTSQPLVERALVPFQSFARIEASSGILLLACTVVALLWANSQWASSYVALWDTPFSFALGDFALGKPLLSWINDGLMAMFFFVVGLEIKREVLVGELSSWRRASLPAAAAVGGMAVPAVIYVLLNQRSDAAAGWGIPMATDIAFALGVLAVLGTRVPGGLRMFLLALAIVDDIGAVLVIAFFYTSHVSWLYLGLGAVFLAALIGANLSGVRHPLVYAALGIGGLWLTFLLSGVHATIAGVIAAMAIPARTRIDPDDFLSKARVALTEFDQAGQHGSRVPTSEGRQSALEELETLSEQVQTPLQRLEHTLHPWVSFVVLPIFALANAGVTIGAELSAAVASPVSLGVFGGLLIGKPLGILLASRLAVYTRLADLPAGVAWRHVVGAGCLGGIGFTMSLFIATLAFEGTPFLTMAKMGILGASLLAALIGVAILRRT